jgi:hypothetical protein
MTEQPHIPEPLGLWLRRQRETACLTREEAAERSGLSARAISDLERGRTRKPHPRSLRLLVRALGLPEAAGQVLIARYRASHSGVTVLRCGQSPGHGWPLPLPPASGQAAAAATAATMPRQMPAAVVPRQLPAAVACLAGRAVELKALNTLLERMIAGAGVPGGTVAVVAIGGTAGVGKTTLAVHWAHQVSDRFTDGHLYLDLRGFSPSGRPMTAAEAIRCFLHALDVHPARIPGDPDAQAALYRSLLAGKRMLIILDNARDTAQVRPLLPGSAGCLVIVTSRSQLPGLAATEAAHLLSLDMFSESEATELLAARLGPSRVAAEQEAARQLTRLCARLPAALAIAAAIAAAAPASPLAVLAAELEDRHSRLDILDTGDTAGNVRALFSWSYRQLSADAARLFRLLGLHPGPDISLPAIISLTGLPVRQVRRALRELTHASLLGEHAPGRYGCHDLLRAYAAEQAASSDSAADRRAAIGRMLDHYLRTAHAASTLLFPHRASITSPAPSPSAQPESLTTRDEAAAWFEAEREVILATVNLAAGSGFNGPARQLAWCSSGFLGLYGRWAELPEDIREQGWRPHPDRRRWPAPCSGLATGAGLGQNLQVGTGDPGSATATPDSVLRRQ